MDKEGNIANFLPHAAPVLLIDKMIESREDVVVCSAHFSNQDYFGGEGLPIYWGIEAIAQAAAVQIALSRQEGEVRPGRLIKAREINFHKDVIPYNHDVSIAVHLKLKSESGLCVYHGEIKDEAGVLYIEAEINLLIE